MKKYRKKPIVISATKYDGKKLDGMFPIAFFQQYNVDWHYGRMITSGDRELIICTLEGEITAEPGDYIVKGIKGELYPVKNEIFKELYDEV